MRISDLIDDADLNIRLRVRGAEGRLDRPITWCAPAEHMDPTPFLSVNALLLTNGMGLNVRDFRIWDAYVERLVSVPVSGLAFGLGAAHRELPEGLLQACEAHGLPLLELPPDVPFVLVMRHVERIIAPSAMRNCGRAGSWQTNAPAWRPTDIPWGRCLGGWQAPSTRGWPWSIRMHSSS